MNRQGRYGRHRGFPPDEQARWLEQYGFTLAEAEDWDRQGFSPEQAVPWRHAGFHNPVAALVWGQHAGFQPEEASQFVEKGYAPVEAVEARRAGLTAETAPVKPL